MARESLFTLPRWSFGLRQLFFWTAAIALGLVALRSASTTWVAAMLGLALAALTMSILLVIFRRGPQRAFWIGFATVGWMYLLLLVVSWTLARMASDDNPLRAHNLITQQLASLSYHWLYDKAFERYYASSPGEGYYGPMAGGGYVGAGMMPSAAGASGMGYGSGDMMSSGGMSMGPGMGGGLGGPVSSPGPPPGPNESDFVNVAHALWTLLFAAMGSCLGFWLYTTDKGRSDSPAAAS